MLVGVDLTIAYSLSNSWYNKRMHNQKQRGNIDFKFLANSYLMLCLALMLIRIAQIINLSAPVIFFYGLHQFFLEPAIDTIFWVVLSFLATPLMFAIANALHKLSFSLGSK